MRLREEQARQAEHNDNENCPVTLAQHLLKGDPVKMFNQCKSLSR